MGAHLVSAGHHNSSMHKSLEIEIWGLGIVRSPASEQGAAGLCRLCGQVAAGVDLEKK